VKPHLPAFFHSIRFRLALWFNLVLAVVLFVFGAIIYFRELQAVRSDASLQLSARLRQFEEKVLNPWRYQHEEDSEIGQIPVATFMLQEGEAALVTDLQGQVKQTGGVFSAAEAGHIAGLGVSISPSLGNPDTRQFTALVKVEGKDEPVDYVFTIHPLPGVGGNAINDDLFILGRPVDAEERMAQLLMTLLLGGTITLLVAAAGGIWLAGRVLRPVQTITRAAQSISANDLHQRLNLNTRDELGELARTFDGMLDRLQAAFDRQRRFTADASHELRTPLAILTLESERVLEGKRSAEEYRRALVLVRSETGFMTHLVEEMLTLARMDSGQVSLKRELLDLSDIAVDAVERFLPLATRNNIQLITGDLPELPIEGDRTALGQMVGNLIDNALKYTPPATGQWVRVETGERIEQNKSLAWLRVSDSGPGISADALPRLFERFYRADEARSRNPDDNDEVPGSGLGLSIVQRIAELHGGSVSVHNVPEGGAAFEIILPRG
jgi:two-component system, OmpR family, sensor kinase